MAVHCPGITTSFRRIVHTAKVTIEFGDLMAFSLPAAFFPALNPLDFKIWSVFEAKVQNTGHYTVRDLHQAQKAHDVLQLNHASACALQPCLEAVITSDGRFIEYNPSPGS